MYGHYSTDEWQILARLGWMDIIVELLNELESGCRAN